MTPDYIFEASWEVCNKVGGIYTVLSTRAKTLQEQLRNKVMFIGPDIWQGKDNPTFIETDLLYTAWTNYAIHHDGLKIRVGRWNIPGEPIVVLVDFMPFFADKNEIYSRMWADYGVDSLHAYGDYDESCMFAIAAAKVAESFYRFNLTFNDKVVFQAHEWMTGMSALYLQKNVPEIATIFTTHATSIGRSIAGNNKPLYDYLFAYNGDQMAGELNMQSKHSIEKQTAHHADCFTTVSEITARECVELLDKPVDVVLPNGFENDFVPKGTTFERKRKTARKRLIEIANSLLHTNLTDDTIIVSTSGRYEFRNKGIDVFIEAMNRLRFHEDLKKNVLAFIEVPGSLSDDRVSGMMNWLGLNSSPNDKVHVVVVPNYLTGDDGLINLSYYDTILGNDLCIYPSYYEPWGYTPLEAVAFKVPCITTDLAGFGLWANSVFGRYGEIEDGVKVIHRTDYNYSDVADAVADTVASFSKKSEKEVAETRKNAAELSKKALWKLFIKHYFEAYDVALRKAEEREVKGLKF